MPSSSRWWTGWVLALAVAGHAAEEAPPLIIDHVVPEEVHEVAPMGDDPFAAPGGRIWAVVGALLESVLPMSEIGRDAVPAQKLQPGRAPPAAQAEPAAYRFAWDENASLVVIGDGIGIARPAWVVTWNRTSGQVLVYYRALAFRDTQGAVHVDARGAEVLGPHRDAWSPDSFAFVGGLVYSMDDNAEHAAHTAILSLVVRPAANEALYRRLLAQAQGIVGENL